MAALNSLSIEFDAANHSFNEISLDELKSHKQAENIIYWIHCNLNQENIFNELAKTLNLPEAVIEACDKRETIPTLINSGETITMRVRCLLSQNFKKDKSVTYGTLVIHLTPHYCLTVTSDNLPAIHEFNEGYSKVIKYAKTPCFILFLILDSIINDYSSILYNIEMISDDIDMKIRSASQTEIAYQDVVAIKKQVTKIKRFMTAIRDILMRISGRKIEAISEQCRLSLADLFDHSQMIVNKSDAIRENLNSTLDQIDNEIMQRMSKSMKILTAFSAFFLPLTLISGIYGMNFDHMPELHWRFGYLLVLGLMVICAGSLIFIFKKMKWL